MSTAIPPEMFDLRHIDRFLEEGRVTQQQYDAWLAGLEDSAAEADESSVRMIRSDSSGRAVGSGHHEEDEG